MPQVTTIHPDGSMVETTPMSYPKAKKLYEALKNRRTRNVYVLTKNPFRP